MKINNCPNCGSTASLDWSALLEMRIGDFQDIHICCDSKDCLYMLSMTLNPDKIICSETERKFIESWNSLTNENK